MKRIYIEREKCQGCLTCMFVCMNVHRKDQGVVEDLPFDSGIESRNYSTFAGKYSTPVICRHCSDPECVATCMSGALHKDPKSGHVNYDPDRCGQCFMCVMCCPYGLPRPDRGAGTQVIRCHFCSGIAQGPSCAQACPSGALSVQGVPE